MMHVHSGDLIHAFLHFHPLAIILGEHLFQLGLRQCLAFARCRAAVPIVNPTRLDTKEARTRLVDAGNERGNAERTD